jgi:hypothetical protein
VAWLLLAEVVFLPYPLKGDELSVALHRKHFLNARKRWTQKIYESAGLVYKWEKEIDAADLGVTEVIARIPISAVVPAYATLTETGSCGIADFGEEVFLSAVAR